VNGNRFAILAQWFTDSVNLVRKWCGKMAGWLSIPFIVFGLFGAFSQRWLFAFLAYASLWSLVWSQNREIKTLKSRAKSQEMAAYDELDELVKQGDEILERLKKNEPPLPTESEFEQWNQRLITLAGSCATITERNRVRAGSVLNVADEEIMPVYLDVAAEHRDTAQKLVSKLKVAREIMERLRRENQIKRS
jgi:hypothetical protein